MYMCTKMMILSLLLSCFTAYVYSTDSNVIQMDEEDFHKLVLGGDEIWIVIFFNPEDKNTLKLVPMYERVAEILKGVVRVGALDVDEFNSIASMYNVEEYPTIKIFGNDDDVPTDFTSELTTLNIVEAALDVIKEKIGKRILTLDEDTNDVAEVDYVIQITGERSMVDTCEGKRLCLIAFLPNFTDIQKDEEDCPKTLLLKLRSLWHTYKHKPWGWLWTRVGVQKDLEEALGLLNTPAIVAVNYNELNYALLKGDFKAVEIEQFLSRISNGKEKTYPIKANEFPNIIEIAPFQENEDQIGSAKNHQEEKDEL